MIKQDFKDPILKKYIDKLPPDTKEIYLTNNKRVRIITASTTHMLNDVVNNFNLGPLETYVLGQAYCIGSVLTSLISGNDTINLKIECAGPIKGLTIESFSNGCVRGYLLENPILIEKPLTSLDTNELYGPGFLTITKTLENSKTPFTGQIMLETGHIAKDLALYFYTSEQTPTVISLDLKFNEKAQLISSGIIFIQALPGSSEDDIKMLEEISPQLKNFADHLHNKKPISEYLGKYFKDLEYLNSSPISFYCPCSKEKTSKFLKAIDKKNKNDILENGPFPLTLNCANCNSNYSFSKEELTKIFNGDNK